MGSSKAYYDSIADEYASISSKRKLFLDRVDQIIIDESQKQQDYADIGAGDGVRSKIIAQGINARSCTLIDESAELLKHVQQDDRTKVIEGSILTLEPHEQFDVVTCLWNVLGHLGDIDQRTKAIEQIAAFTRPKGFAFIDVNNRYNVQEYGVDSVMKNVMADSCSMPESGWFQLAQSDAKTKVYIHEPFELDPVFERCGFKILHKYYVDYSTGEVHNDFWKGQVLYKLQKDT